MRDEVMPVLGISSLAVDLSFKEKNEQRDSNNLLNFCEQAEQTESVVCGLLSKVSLSWRHNEDELESFTETLLKYACHLFDFKIHAFCPYPEKWAVVKEKLFGAEIVCKLRPFPISLQLQR